MKTSDRKILKGYYWNHDAIRKDMDRLKHVIDHFSSYTAADFMQINKWYQYHEKCILIHHHGEDEFFFPIMSDKKPQFKIELDMMVHEHILLDEGLSKIKAILAELSAGKPGLESAFISAATDYRNLVIAHLDQEERIVELVVADVPLEDIMKTEDEYRNGMSREDMMLAMPWMLDAMDEKDRKYFFTMVPFFVKWIYNLSGKPKFAKLVSFK